MKSTPSPPRTPMKSFSGGRTSSRFFGPRTLESVEEASQCTAVANSPAPESPDSDATVTPLAHSVPLPGSRNNGSSQSFSPKNDVFSGSSSIADTISAVSLPDPFTTPRSTSYPSTDEQRPLYFPSLIGTAPFTATQPFRLCPTTSHLNMRTPALDPATSSRLDMRIPTSGPSTSSSLPGLAQRSAPAPSYPTAQAPLSLQGQHKLAREKWIRDSAREIALLAQKVKACQAKYLVTSKLADYQEYMHAREQFMQATSLERRLEQRRQIGLPPGMKPLRTGAGNLPGDGFQGLGFQGLGQEGGSEVGDGSGKLLGYRMALMEKTCGQVYKPEYSSNHDTNGTCIPTSSSSPTHTTTQPRTKAERI
ncbi:hypothetical protein P154DRAFT_532775 [Amniculicola lignicola CBS 123094]|uniref:Uncharacterized protein n=1 Tax=Amniculicola lignicola CBS 123094 TaxID=1392246 RepID=A0A6A5WV36_9PLEO|nr:hypothetical protein P154DRAFT_532775 [Amniculicola lignicola CBS 123094]